jgi:hypothetical protein
MKIPIFYAAISLAASATLLEAQLPKLPDTYSYSAASNMVWPDSTHQVNRSGSKVLVEIKNAKGDFHVIQLYDLQAHKLYNTDLIAKTCTVNPYTSPNAPDAQDPIGGSERMRTGMAAAPPKVLRTEVMNGIRARVIEVPIPDPKGKFTFWIEEKYGFPVKHTMALGSQPERLLFEMRQLSYAPPAASLFAPPAQCTPVGGSTSATGGHVEAQVEAQTSATHDLSEPAAAAPAAASGKVTGVRLRLDPPRFQGPCPGSVKLVADITTDGPATVWYEFLAGAVRKRGPGEGTVTFKAAGTQTITLEAEYVSTPQVPQCSLIAAPVNQDGSHGPQTVSSNPANFNARCTAPAPAGRK